MHMKRLHIDKAEVHRRDYGDLVLLAGNTGGPMRTENADLKFLRIRPGASTSHHYHAVAESIFHVLRGNLASWSPTGEIKLKAGDTMIVDPLEPHMLKNVGRSTAVVLEIESPPHSSRDKFHVSGWNFEISSKRRAGAFWSSRHSLPLKICGVKNFDTAVACSRLGVQAIGIHAMKLQNPARILQTWSSWLSALPERLSIFLLTDVTDVKQLLEFVRWSNCDTVQLQGVASREIVEELGSKLRPLGLKLVKSVGIRGANEKNLLNYVEAITPHIDGVLLDSTYGGGTGVPHDWGISSKIATLARVPVILAGGLRKTNLRAAVARVRPFGVDIESGVESKHNSANGCTIKAKSFDKIHAVVEICKSIESRHGNKSTYQRPGY